MYTSPPAPPIFSTTATPQQIHQMLVRKGWYTNGVDAASNQMYSRYFEGNTVYCTWCEACLIECLPLLMALESAESVGM